MLFRKCKNNEPKPELRSLFDTIAHQLTSDGRREQSLLPPPQPALEAHFFAQSLQLPEGAFR